MFRKGRPMLAMELTRRGKVLARAIYSVISKQNIHGSKIHRPITVTEAITVWVVLQGYCAGLSKALMQELAYRAIRCRASLGTVYLAAI